LSPENSFMPSRKSTPHLAHLAHLCQ
jgi:hypothetical protein